MQKTKSNEVKALQVVLNIPDVTEPEHLETPVLNLTMIYRLSVFLLILVVGLPWAWIGAQSAASWFALSDQRTAYEAVHQKKLDMIDSLDNQGIDTTPYQRNVRDLSSEAEIARATQLERREIEAMNIALTAAKNREAQLIQSYKQAHFQALKDKRANLRYSYADQQLKALEKQMTPLAIEQAKAEIQAETKK